MAMIESRWPPFLLSLPASRRTFTPLVFEAGLAAMPRFTMPPRCTGFCSICSLFTRCQPRRLGHWPSTLSLRTSAMFWRCERKSGEAISALYLAEITPLAPARMPHSRRPSHITPHAARFYRDKWLPLFLFAAFHTLSSRQCMIER